MAPAEGARPGRAPLQLPSSPSSPLRSIGGLSRPRAGGTRTRTDGPACADNATAAAWSYQPHQHHQHLRRVVVRPYTSKVPV